MNGNFDDAKSKTKEKWDAMFARRYVNGVGEHGCKFMNLHV